MISRPLQMAFYGKYWPIDIKANCSKFYGQLSFSVKMKYNEDQLVVVCGLYKYSAFYKRVPLLDLSGSK